MDMDSTTTYQARFTRDSGKITQKNNDTKQFSSCFAKLDKLDKVENVDGMDVKYCVSKAIIMNAN